MSPVQRDVTPAGGLRRAAVRMVAAAEYFKAAGELPPWARAELESWSEPHDGVPERGPVGRAGSS